MTSSDNKHYKPLQAMMLSDNKHYKPLQAMMVVSAAALYAAFCDQQTMSLDVTVKCQGDLLLADLEPSIHLNDFLHKYTNIKNLTVLMQISNFYHSITHLPLVCEVLV